MKHLRQPMPATTYPITLIIFIHTHPIQYFAPLYRYLTEQGITLQVWYMDDSSIKGAKDREFGQQIQWDIPLLEGYAYRFFANEAAGGQSPRGYRSYQNLSLLQALQQEPPAWVVVHGWSFATYVQVLQKATVWGHRLAFRGETNLAMEMARPAWQRPLRKIMLRYLLRKVSHFFAIGQQSAQFYQWLGLPAERVSVAPYAVDNARFQQAAQQLDKQALRRSYGWPDSRLVCLFSGKFIAKKRPMDLLAALSRLKGQPIQLIMMGAGELQADMEAFISKQGLAEQVWLTGFVNQQQVSTFYRMADVLVMCSDFGETWGLSVNEAMNFSMPVVVSQRTGCAPDLVQPGINGYVCSAGDVAALAAILQQLQQMPATQRQAMGAASLQIVNEHGFAAIEAALRRVLYNHAAIGAPLQE